MKFKFKILFFIILLLLLIFLFFIIINIVYFTLLKNYENYKTILNKILESTKLVNKIDVPIYYINLDRSTSRKQFMENQFLLVTFKFYSIPMIKI